jgi:elongation factor Ts
LDISIEQVKKLREKTGAGMMDCKNALNESGGDFEKAIEILRKKGAATSAKRSDRIAKEGMTIVELNDLKNEAVIVETNCETDFVARSEAFINFTKEIVNVIFRTKNASIDDLKKEKLDEKTTVQDLHDELAAKVGEKVEIKRAGYFSTGNGFFCGYNHIGNKIASLVELSGDVSEKGILLGNDLAMQVVAMKPIAIDRSQVDKTIIEKEKEIYATLARNEGKPENIVDKIASNKIEKFYQENCLLDQEFIKEAGKTVSEIIKSVSKDAGTEYQVKTIIRYQLGE